MANEPAAITRQRELVAELEPEIANEIQMANWNHRLSLGFMIVALLFSVATAIAGIFIKAKSEIVGAMAILPALIAYVAINLKLNGKSSWHYRMADGLDGFRSRLLYQLPDPPTVENIAGIAQARDAFIKEMQEEWDRTLALNWSGLAAHSATSQSNALSGTRGGAAPNAATGRPARRSGHLATGRQYDE